MALTLHLHPLSSYCHKVLMALYENGTTFEASIVNMMDSDARAAYLKISPFGKIPSLTDSTRNVTVNETSIMIEYLQQHYPGPQKFIPEDAEAALSARMWDRIVDHYLHTSMQKIVGDTMRPDGAHDPHGVADARRTMQTALDLLEQRLAEVPHPGGDKFTIADCAAAPPLFYAQAILPYAESHPRVARYFEALSQRPSFVRLIGEAKPFFQYFPFVDRLPKRFTA
jgi:glutathione S-transferase